MAFLLIVNQPYFPEINLICYCMLFTKYGNEVCSLIFYVVFIYIGICKWYSLHFLCSRTISITLIPFAFLMWNCLVLLRILLVTLDFFPYGNWLLSSLSLLGSILVVFSFVWFFKLISVVVCIVIVYGF